MAKNIIPEQDYARFAQLTGLNEYNFSTGIREADDDPQQGGTDPNAMGGDPNMGGMGDPNAMGGAPGMGGMQDPNMGGMGDPNAMGGEPNMGGMGDPNAGGLDMGGMEGPDLGSMDDPLGGPDMSGMGGNDEVGPDDDVVDIEALTRAQQATEYKIDDVSDRITTLERALEKFASATRDCGAKIDRVMSELERRVPTEEEQRARRVMNDTVYNNPAMAQQAVGNNADQEYVITTGDLKNLNNAEVMKSVVDYPKKFNDFLDL